MSSFQATCMLIIVLCVRLNAQYVRTTAQGCQVLSSRDNRPCVFPFTYKGTVYFGCTTEGSSEGLLWCGVTFSVTDEDDTLDDWGYCRFEGDCIGLTDDADFTTPVQETEEVLNDDVTDVPGFSEVTFSGPGFGDLCVSSCVELEDGDYQSCLGCFVYASCVGGNLHDNRTCPDGLLWDDSSKYCLHESTTCDP